MFQSFRRSVLIFAILLTVALSTGSAEEKPPVGSGRYTIIPLEGPPREIRTAEGVLKLETAYGLAEVRLSSVKRVAFGADGDRPTATIELADHTTLKGRVLTSELADETGRAIPLSGVRELVPIDDANKGWLSLILGLITLSLMEIVLGIDNVIFLAIVAAKLPPEQQPKARKIGLIVALLSRLVLLASLSFLLGLTKPIFVLPDNLPFHDLESREISVRDLILIVGGTFLIYKSVREMHDKLEHAAKSDAGKAEAPKTTFTKVLIQIAAIDIIFSLDSVITAVGMVRELWVMAAAMVIAMGVMLLFSEYIANFVEKHPTIKVLALSFLILIGMLLVVEGLGQHVDKGYIYFAMGFAFLVEVVNLQVSRKPAPAGRDSA